jgi:hypothetical protein
MSPDFYDLTRVFLDAFSSRFRKCERYPDFSAVGALRNVDQFFTGEIQVAFNSLPQPNDVNVGH